MQRARDIAATVGRAKQFREHQTDGGARLTVGGRRRTVDLVFGYVDEGLQHLGAGTGA
jgi:hypothetical protein